MTEDDARDDDGRASGAFRADAEAIPTEDIPLRYRYAEGDLIAGKYRLRRLLGRGGMGDVWLAHNETLDIDIAIKLMRSDADGGAAGDRLLREARAAARLGHPAIVRVFDFGATEYAEPFIVMEFLHGEDLATSLAHHGRFSGVKAVRTLLPIAHALETAHAKQIVHRDVKPENIFLTETEEGRIQPKIVDFGIAKIDRGKGLRLTQKGTVVGSPGYMAPEQARGDDIDHRADIWSFCVVLYEALTGAQPFVGKNDNALLYAIVAHEPAPITSLAAGDAALSAILTKGFAKNPDKRWQSMHELGAALAKWLIAQGATEDIAGASLEATWLVSARGDVFGTAAPDDFVRRRATMTERSARRRSAGPRLVALGLVALVLAGGAILSMRKPGAPAAPPAVSGVVSRLTPAPSAAPGEPAAEPSTSPPAPGPSATGGAEPASEHPVHVVHARALVRGAPQKPKSEPGEPRPTLKDPFQ